MRTLIFGQATSARSVGYVFRPVFPMGANISGQDGGFFNILSDSDTRYDLYCPINGVLQNFRMKTNIGVGQPLTLEIINRTTTVSTTLFCDTAETSASDDITQIAVSAGDLIHVGIRCDCSNDPVLSWSFQLVGNNSNETFITGNFFSQDGTNSYVINTVTPAYYSPVCASLPSATESKRRFYCTTSGTIKSFNVKQSVSNGGTGGATYSIYKNGVEEASSIVTFGPNGTTYTVTGLSISFVAGDSLSIKYNQTSAISDFVKGVNWTIMYNPTTDGEQMIGGLQEISSSNTQGVVQYGYINGASPFAGNGNLNTTEARRQMYLAGFTTAYLRNFRVNLESAPGASQTREYRVRVNGANGNEVIDITGASTSGSDSSNTETLASGDLVDITHEALT